MSEYKSLPLDRESIHSIVCEFTEQNGLRIDDSNVNTQGDVVKSHRYKIGKPQMQSAIIDFLCNVDGTTTVHYKTGKNQDLGLELAGFVKNKINPNEFESIEMTLQHLSIKDVMPIYNKFESETYSDNTKMFKYEEEVNSDFLLQVRVTSSRHQDCLVLKYHKSANSFQIQGRPLFVYKKLSYFLIDILELWGIEKVLSRKDENRTEFISQDVARHTLKSLMPDAYEKLPIELNKLLVSGMCIALASPELPDYSVLLYPELRTLEGSMYDCFNAYGLYSSNYTDNGDQRIGVMFHKSGDDSYSLKHEHFENIENTDMIRALENAYNQYTGKRHPLFHVEEELIFSKFITSLDVAMNMLTDIRECINELYKFKP
jgi:hypothetical protein